MLMVGAPRVPSTTGSSTERPAAESVSTTCLLSDTGVLLRIRFNFVVGARRGPVGFTSPAAIGRSRRRGDSALPAARRAVRGPRQGRHYRIPDSTAKPATVRYRNPFTGLRT